MAKKITLTNLRELKDDWDGDGSPPPTEAAIDLAEAILNTPGLAFATPEGGVQIEWHVGDEHALIDITPHGLIEHG